MLPLELELTRAVVVSVRSEAPFVTLRIRSLQTLWKDRKGTKREIQVRRLL